MATNECYCDPTDRTFYRTVMMFSTISWTSFLSIYIIYCTCGLKRIIVDCTRQHKIKTNSGIHEYLVKLIKVLEEREKKFKAQLRELVTTKFLDDEHCESIRKHYYGTSLYWTKTDTASSEDPSGSSHQNGEQNATEESSNQANSEPVQAAGLPNTTANCCNVHMHVVQVEQHNTVHAQAGIESGLVSSEENNAVHDEVSEQANNEQNNTGQLQAHSEQDTDSEQIRIVNNASDNELLNPSEGPGQITRDNDQEPQTSRRCSRWCCFMILKLSLIAIRFVFRLLIVPLLQLQLLNDYAWYCLLNDVIRNYCETETNKYYIGLDHSMVNYCVYILLLIALLFSFLINWFPKGMPQLVLLYKAGRILIKKETLQVTV